MSWCCVSKNLSLDWFEVVIQKLSASLSEGRVVAFYTKGQRLQPDIKDKHVTFCNKILGEFGKLY